MQQKYVYVETSLLICRLIHLTGLYILVYIFLNRLEKVINEVDVFKIPRDSATEMVKDGKHWKNCCKKMSFLSKNLSDTV